MHGLSAHDPAADIAGPITRWATGYVVLRRGPAYRTPDGQWRGDVTAPLIRDLGVTLDMAPGQPEIVRMVLNAHWSVEEAQRADRDLSAGERDWITSCIAIVKAVQD